MRCDAAAHALEHCEGDAKPLPVDGERLQRMARFPMGERWCDGGEL